MMTSTMTRPEPNVRVEMKAHRERLKTAVHPGVTQKEAGFTEAQRARLVDGVCADLSAATECGERWANWALVVLAGLLFVAIGIGIVQDRWAEQRLLQTVEAGR